MDWSYLNLCSLRISGDFNPNYSGCLYGLRNRSNIGLCDLRCVMEILPGLLAQYRYKIWILAYNVFCGVLCFELT